MQRRGYFIDRAPSEKVSDSRLRFNEAKLQKLNGDVHLGFANLRGLQRSQMETSQEIFRLRREIAGDPVTLYREKEARYGRKALDDDVEPSALSRIRDLERRLKRHESKKASLATLYEVASREQEARSRLLESSVAFLRANGINVEFTIDRHTYSEQLLAGSLVEGFRDYGGMPTGRIDVAAGGGR